VHRGTHSHEQDSESSLMKSKDSKKPSIAVPTGNGGVLTSASGLGELCEKTTVLTAPRGTISLTTMPAQKPTGGAKTASAASATAIKPVGLASSPSSCSRVVSRMERLNMF
jgi:hypothetical protein